MKIKFVFLSIALVISFSSLFAAEAKPDNFDSESAILELYERNSSYQKDQVDNSEACAIVTLSCGWWQYKCAEGVLALINWTLAAEEAVCGGEMGELMD